MYWSEIIYLFWDTVEVRDLHTLRLESLKLIFQPLHTFLVNKLSFWQVGEDMYFVHDTSNFSNNCSQTDYPTIVHRQIISPIIHCITIPVGQKFTYTKLTDCAFKQLGKLQKMMSWL